MALAILNSAEEWRARFSADGRGSVVTVGNFDGMHLGHCEILRRSVEQAHMLNAQSVAITFDPHPLRFLRPSDAPALLMTLPQRLAALEAEHLDAVLVLKFDSALEHLSPDDFVQKILVDTLGTRAVLVGQNFRFGYKQAGDVELLRERGKAHGFAVECIPAVSWRGRTISSSAIRQAVGEGRLIRAGRMLGRPYGLAGEIQQGEGRGRRAVYPTLNLRTEQELLPKPGVYATEVFVDSRLHRAVTNVGIRPTFGGGSISIESYLFDFSQDLSSGPMEVRFWPRLRDEMKFPGADVLRMQIQQDERRARQFFRLIDRFSLKKQSA
ncbi:MAG: bifunctional riboflavin kinase/FAD synthetase [Candidatus Acidiferrales bacterium]|jgi:riboflavin kinase/FMN adenylyltransferase